MLDESQARIKIARKNINNLWYAYDTTLKAESPFLDYCNNPVVNIGIHVYFWIMFFYDYVPRNGIAGSHDTYIFKMLYLNILCIYIYILYKI